MQIRERATIEIRPERPEDKFAIGDVIDAAFAGKPYADGDEAEVVERLRTAGALTISLVAVYTGRVVGQVAFSPARASDGTSDWYTLGPVAVLPAQQGRGIGSALVHAGLAALSERGANGCILTGDPEYYRRFGFAVSPAHAPPDEEDAFFMVKPLGGSLPPGSIHFHPAFAPVDAAPSA